MIESAGLVRLGELHLLIDGWDYSTIDNLRGTYNAASLSPFRSDGWTLLVDGQQINMDLQGSKDLNLLPVALHDVEYIEVVDVPTIVAGTLAAHGTIHIHTTSPPAGVSLRGSFWLGNETGDDGPYRYLESNTENIDHTGAEVHSSAAMRSGRSWARISEVSVHIPVTDRAIKPRIQGLSDSWPTINAIMLAARIHLESDRSTHDLSAMTSPVDDFFRHRAWGREIPANTRLHSINASGSLRIGDSTGLAYHLAYSRNRIQEKANLQDLDYDWDLNILSAGLEASETRGRITKKIGIRHESQQLNTGYNLREHEYGKTSGFVQLQGIGSDRRDHDVGLYLNLYKDDLALAGILTSHWMVDRHNRISSVIAAGTRSFREDHSYWCWVESGYRFLARSEYALVHFIHEQSRYLSLDILWKNVRESGATFDVRGYFRKFADLTLERSDFTFDSSDFAYSGFTSLTSGIDGRIAGLRISANHRISARLDGHISFETRTVLAGGRLFHDHWNTRPAHQARFRIRYAPVSSFWLFMQTSYRSATTWAEYAGARTASEGLFTETIPAHWNIDITANKWFGHRRVRGSIIFRNLLNQRFRYHPVGATFDLSVLARFEFYLGTLNSSKGH